MATIFISHSSRDGTLASEVRVWLAKDGYDQVFLDFDKHTGLQAGENWERHLYEEIERCHAVILVLTPNWLESKWCFVEFTQGRALGKIIFPIILSPLGDARVAPEIQGVDLRDWNVEGGVGDFSEKGRQDPCRRIDDRATTLRGRGNLLGSRPEDGH